MANDDKVGSADRGSIKKEIRHIETGKKRLSEILVFIEILPAGGQNWPTLEVKELKMTTVTKMLDYRMQIFTN